MLTMRVIMQATDRTSTTNATLDAGSDNVSPGATARHGDASGNASAISGGASATVEGADLHYTLNRDDRIVAVGGMWDEAARAGGSPGLVAGRIEGTSLYDHIAGMASRKAISTMLENARGLGRPSTRTYRCDTPTLKRLMEMTIWPRPDGELQVEHRQLACEARIRPITFVPASIVSAGSHRRRCVTRCSLCNRVRVAGVWGEAEERLVITEEAAPVSVIYGVCPDCRARVHELYAASRDRDRVYPAS